MGKKLLPCCCIRDSIKFYMQHDHVLKNVELTPGGGGGGGSAGKIFATCCIC